MGYQLNLPTSATALARHLGLELVGPERSITAVASLEDHVPGDLIFAKSAAEPVIGSVCLTSHTDDPAPEQTAIRTENPRLDFIRALAHLDDTVGFVLPSSPAQIHSTARVGANVVIEAGCVIGEGCVIEPNVVLHAGTRLGKRTRIRSNSSIGSDGFGFERLPDGTPVRFPHLGAVHIGDDVEIGSCTAIARGTLSNTVIENHVKIDNLVHIAHNCLIRRGAFVIACAEISGGVEVGENAWVAPSVSTHQKITIGAESLVGLGAVVTRDVPERTVYAGNPAKKLRDL